MLGRADALHLKPRRGGRGVGDRESGGAYGFQHRERGRERAVGGGRC